MEMNLTISEAADFLGVADETIRRWIRQGSIPARRVRGGYALSRVSVERWARTHHMAVREPAAPSGTGKTDAPLVLTDVLSRGGVHFNVGGSDPESAIRAAIQLMPVPDAVSKEDTLDRILKREALASTGIGKGIAIPHPRTPTAGPYFESLVMTCFLEKPIDFLAIDGLPVFVMFLMLCPSIRRHLEILSQISFILRDDAFIDFLKGCHDEELFYEKVAAMQEGLNRDE